MLQKTDTDSWSQKITNIEAKRWLGMEVDILQRVI